MIGFATTPKSTVAMASTYGENADTALRMVIYKDFGAATARPAFTAAAGLTTAPSSGLQFHFEARGTVLPLSVVTGPTATQNLQPQTRSVLKPFFSVLMGLEIVLKREHGKRY
jgi:hypothetical protein